jgi:hypothetical protein
MRNRKTYQGELMKKGKLNEHIVINWLKNYSREIIDFREFRLAQRIDVDCGIETLDGSIILAEIKSDNYISEKGNLFFECNRINHFVKDKWFYLGWGWRSPAQKLIIRNPENNEIYVFNFEELRIFVGKYISDVGKNLNTMIIETDEQKTTFGYLIPMHRLKEIYKSYYV